MDKENVKLAIDKFEDDDFVGSKEIIQSEIQKKKEEYFKDKLGLKGDDETNVEPDMEDNKEEE
jgi:hypothetical protein